MAETSAALSAIILNVNKKYPTEQKNKRFYNNS